MNSDLAKQIKDNFYEIRSKKKTGYLISYTDYSDNTSTYFTLNKFRDYKNLFKRLIDIFSESYVNIDAILDLSEETFEKASIKTDAINNFINSEYDYYRSKEYNS